MAVFLDVDGTLLEIAARPDQVRVAPSLRGLLRRLAAERGGALALISGRSIADLDALFRPWCGAAAGLHGAERRRADGGYDGAGGAAVAAVARLRPLALEWANAASGVLVEDKGAALALHYRAAPERGPEVHAFAERLARIAAGALALVSGKMVVELRPDGADKGRAIAAFLDEPPFRGRRPVYLGDDVTDEDGFAEVNRRGGISIRVGAPAAATAARDALPSVAAAQAWLAGRDGFPPDEAAS